LLALVFMPAIHAICDDMEDSFGRLMRRVPTLRVLEPSDLPFLACLAVPAAVSTNGIMHATLHPACADGEVWSTFLDRTSIQARRIERT
jgi:hypothetical protein